MSMRVDLTNLKPVTNFDPSKYPKVEGWSLDLSWLPPRRAFRILCQSSAGEAILVRRPEGKRALITGEARVMLDGGAKGGLFAGAMLVLAKLLPGTTCSFTGSHNLGDEPMPPLAEGETEGEGIEKRPQAIHRVLVHEFDVDPRDYRDLRHSPTYELLPADRLLQDSILASFEDPLDLAFCRMLRYDELLRRLACDQPLATPIPRPDLIW